MQSLSTEEKEIINQMAELHKETGILKSQSQFFELLLVLLEEKSATHLEVGTSLSELVFTNTNTEQSSFSEDEARDKLFSIVSELTTINQNISIVNGKKDTFLFIYNTNKVTKEQINEVKKMGVEEDINHKLIGNFFGYPESSINFFITDDSYDKGKASVFKQFLEESDEYDADGYHRATEFTSYIPSPTKESFEQALQTNQERKELLSSLDLDEHDALNQYISERILRFDISKIRNK